MTDACAVDLLLMFVRVQRFAAMKFFFLLGTLGNNTSRSVLAQTMNMRSKTWPLLISKYTNDDLYTFKISDCMNVSMLADVS